MTFKVYDKVWIMRNNKPTKMLVFAVVESMDYWKRSTEIHYNLVDSVVGAGWGNNSGIRMKESEIFGSREALIESITTDGRGQ